MGKRTLGFIDFTGPESELGMAGGARMDLVADEHRARELHEAGCTAGAAELEALDEARREAHEDRTQPAAGRRARERFNRHYSEVNTLAGNAGGTAMMVKIDTKLAELGWPPLTDGAVLEAGGGRGQYLPAFAERFERVVFVDASLTNIVLAAKRAAEAGLRNIAYVRANVMALPFRSGSFDFVHQNGVVEHVDNPRQMVAEGIRVRRSSGYYVCVSPNRMALTREPHFRLPAFGFIPSRLRPALIRRVRGYDLDDAGTDPRTLAQLRSYLDNQRDEMSVVFFLPRHLPFTALQTPLRRLIGQALGRRRVGDAVDYLLNDLFLTVMPYHIMITRRP